jgi:hypothetical protein
MGDLRALTWGVALARMSDSVDKTYGVRFKFSSGNPGPGDWEQQTLFGLTSEPAARHFYEAAIANPHMSEIYLLHGDDTIDQHE